MTPDQRISEADWAITQHNAATAAPEPVDPYVLAAIAGWETAFGTLGEGRPAPQGNGLVLGVGAFDSGPQAGYGGWDEQTRVGTITLHNLGVHTIDDIAAGKCHTDQDANGKVTRVRWASADVRPGYQWTAGVIAQFNHLVRDPIEVEEIDMILVNSSPGGWFIVGPSGRRKISDAEAQDYQAIGVKTITVSPDKVGSIHMVTS